MPRVSRIVVDPAILKGKPVVRGTRFSVEFLIGLLAQGWSEAEILRNYPGLTHEDLDACRASSQTSVAYTPGSPESMANHAGASP
uniref:DUF433 domain-containing protein n=1 Tax=Schlesneria paludicola TaxID=360056 RepID=A0A7C2PGD1_9PLAN